MTSIIEARWPFAYPRGSALQSDINGVQGDGWFILLSIGADLEYAFRSTANGRPPTVRGASGHETLASTARSCSTR